MAENTENQERQATEETQTDDTAGAGDGGNSGSDSPVDFTSEQQSKIDDVVKERLARERRKWEQELKEAEEKAKQEAEKQRLKEQEEYRELAEEYEAELEKLQPIAKKFVAYRDTVSEILEADLKVLGKPAQNAVENLPGDLDTLDKLQWLRANRDLFVKKEAPSVDAEDHGTDDGEPDPSSIARRFGIQSFN